MEIQAKGDRGATSTTSRRTLGKQVSLSNTCFWGALAQDDFVDQLLDNPLDNLPTRILEGRAWPVSLVRGDVMGQIHKIASRAGIHKSERIDPRGSPSLTDEYSFNDTTVRAIGLPLPAAPLGADGQSYFHIPQADWFRTHLYFRPGKRPTRVFLVINGLNEIRDWDLYNDLAIDLIERADGEVACLLIPAPFHLDRYPNFEPKISGKGISHPRPLDLFFSNPIQLWRMYRAQMEEIDLIVRLLLPKSKGLFQTRSSPLKSGRKNAMKLIQDARKYLQRALAPAHLHTVGFSLGGLAALSAFSLNPDCIDGCVPICSGVALQTLNLLQLCEPEERQNLLISLRDELHVEFGMLKSDYETKLWRTFSDFYARTSEYSFKRSIESFSRRILFVVGGQDPVVPLDTVIRDAPEGGESILNLAGVQHFVTQDQAWYSWKELTTAAILNASGIATSNRVRTLTSHGSRSGGATLQPQRILDDLSYFTKMLRASGDFIGDLAELKMWRRKWADALPADIQKEMRDFRRWLGRLTVSAEKSVPPVNLERVFDTPPAIEFQPGVKLSALRSQLFLIELIESDFCKVDAAMFRFPTEVQCPALVKYRVENVCMDEAERSRYWTAIYFRKALVFDRLATDKEAEFRLLIPRAFLRKFTLSNERLVGRRGVSKQVRIAQLMHLATLRAQFPGLQVRIVGEEAESPLLRSFYLSYGAKQIGRQSGLDLSRVNFDRTIRGTVLDTRTNEGTWGKTAPPGEVSQFQRRAETFQVLWEHPSSTDLESAEIDAWITRLQ